jgi:putative transposase
LVEAFPYLILDARYERVREAGVIASQAVLIEIVGLCDGPLGAETFWSGFPKSQARRGLRGIKLVISDAHEGLKRRSGGCLAPAGSAAVCIGIRNDFRAWRRWRGAGPLQLGRGQASAMLPRVADQLRRNG